MKNVLSKRQTDTLNAIRDHIKRTGIPASRKELQVALGLRSQAGVDRLLDALARKKYVQIHPGVDRGLRLLREGAPIVDTDELPRVAAGPPTVACDQPEPARLHDYDSVADQFSERPDWFVRADGDSESISSTRAAMCSPSSATRTPETATSWSHESERKPP